MSGGGLIRLGAVNTYTGPTNILSGGLVVSDSSAIGGTGPINITETNGLAGSTQTVAFSGGSLVLDGMASGSRFREISTFRAWG